MGADCFQLLFNLLVAAVDVVNAVYDGFAIRHQSRQNQRGRGAQIGRQHGRAAQLRFTANGCATAFNPDIRAHAQHFLRVHEAVFEDIFRDDRRAFGLRGQRHELRLHVGRKARVLFGVDIGGFEWTITLHADAVAGFCDLNSGLFEFLKYSSEMTGITSGHVQVAAGQRSGDDEGTCFDAVGDDAVFCAMQFGYALHTNCGGACAFNFRAHFDEQIG